MAARNQRQLRNFRAGSKPKALPGGIGKRARQGLKSAPRVVKMNSAERKRERAWTQMERRVLPKIESYKRGVNQRISTAIEREMNKWGLKNPLRRRLILKACWGAREEYFQLLRSRNNASMMLQKAETAIELLSQNKWDEGERALADTLRISLERKDLREWKLQRDAATLGLKGIERDMNQIYDQTPDSVLRAIGLSAGPSFWKRLRQIVIDER